MLKKRKCLRAVGGSSHKRHLKPSDFINCAILNLRKNYLLPDTQTISPAEVQF